MMRTVFQRIGPYEILHEIGRGGMAQVFLANDTRTSQCVALRLVPTGGGYETDGTLEAERWGARLQERWGIAAAETLAIGDNANDREMLEAAGLGMVMGNALPEILALGFPVLPSNEDDGVAVAIEEHILTR